MFFSLGLKVRTLYEADLKRERHASQNPYSSRPSRQRGITTLTPICQCRPRRSLSRLRIKCRICLYRRLHHLRIPVRLPMRGLQIRVRSLMLQFRPLHHANLTLLHLRLSPDTQPLPISLVLIPQYQSVFLQVRYYRRIQKSSHSLRILQA